MTKEEAIKELSYIADEMPSMECADWREAISMAIKALEQEPKIKVLDNNEVARKLGTVDVYTASTWATLLNDLEYLGLKICEVEK